MSEPTRYSCAFTWGLLMRRRFRKKLRRMGVARWTEDKRLSHSRFVVQLTVSEWSELDIWRLRVSSGLRG